MSAGWIAFCIIMSYVALLCWIVYEYNKLKKQTSMRELSIEEKAKRFDEALVKARRYYDEHKTLDNILSFLNTLEVIDPYEQRVQYDSIKSGIQAHAETYSFNIESELYNQQTTKEGQKLWRKEIEEAYIRGGEAGVELARDPRYKENLEVKEVDLEKEIDRWQGCEAFPEGVGITPLPKAMEIVERTAKHFFELGLKAQKGEEL